MRTILVVGATGMTGRCLVEQLLAGGHRVRAIVRSPGKLPSAALIHPNLTVIVAAVLDLTEAEMAEHAKGCDAVASCLGHVLSFRGMFGQPRQLCTDATRRLCSAMETNDGAGRAKFVLMNTVGVRNPDLAEQRTWYERWLLALLRLLVPPHRDNETAAEYLHGSIRRDHGHVEWCTVRPDSLIDADVSPYDIGESPVTGLFTGRPTTRSNVAHFMTELIVNEELWNTWKFRMPVIMDSKESV